LLFVATLPASFLAIPEDFIVYHCKTDSGHSAFSDRPCGLDEILVEQQTKTTYVPPASSSRPISTQAKVSVKDTSTARGNTSQPKTKSDCKKEPNSPWKRDFGKDKADC
jgi:hypothetical protein